MNRKTMLCLLAALLCLAAIPLPAAAAEVDCDSTYCFSAGDFSGEAGLAGICITSLPDSETGTVLLGSRVLRPGDILTAGQLEQMTFRPVQTEYAREAVMTYLPIYSDRVEAAATMSIAVIGKQNQAPVAEDSTLETYKNLPNEAMLKVKDPEGEALTFTVVRQPRRGEVTIREDGSYVYVPKKNKVGVDSFTYTAADPAGNVSREATVTVTILKPSDARQYRDTEGKSCRFAAEWMKNTGIFVGESIGGNGCFQPGKEVSRGEFLTMLVGALGIEPDDSVQYTGYSDECPGWLKPYLAAAMRSGLTTGWPDGSVFSPDTPITGAEAAVMLQNALDLSFTAPAGETAAGMEDQTDVPVWAKDALTALAENGIELSADANLTRGETAEMMYRVWQMKDEAPGVRTLRAAQ